MRIAVGIATTGRQEMLAAAVAEVARQDRRPDRVIVCVAGPQDAAADLEGGDGLDLSVIRADLGLPRQRNAILAALRGFDAVLFIDDDFLPRRDYLATVERILSAHPDVAMLTGTLLADGARGAGVPLDEGRAMLAASRPVIDVALTDVDGAYGCNMAVRLAPVFDHGIRFNENLPLYGWLEDLDFSRRMAPHGRIVRSREPQGVHLAVKNGRVSGLRYGYSQIANPIELWREGLISGWTVLTHAGRNLVGNLGRSLAPEAHVDRRGRLAGNVRALADLARGRLSPRGILEL